MIGPIAWCPLRRLSTVATCIKSGLAMHCTRVHGRGVSSPCRFLSTTGSELQKAQKNGRGYI